MATAGVGAETVAAGVSFSITVTPSLPPATRPTAPLATSSTGLVTCLTAFFTAFDLLPVD